MYGCDYPRDEVYFSLKQAVLLLSQAPGWQKIDLNYEKTRQKNNWGQSQMDQIGGHLSKHTCFYNSICNPFAS